MQREPVRLRYGALDDQWLDYSEGDTNRPTVVLIHGGFWRDRFDASLMLPLAEHLSEQGWSVANLEYRRSNPNGGSRWPAMGDDVLSALKHVVALKERSDASSKLILVGHSAGGHLALLAASNPELASHIAGVVALAPVTDLTSTHQLGLGEGAVLELMPDGFSAEHLAAISPSEAPPEVAQLVVHGDNDDRVPFDQSVAYEQAASAHDIEVTLLPIAGGDHFHVIDPAHSVWAAIDEWMLELSEASAQP